MFVARPENRHFMGFFLAVVLIVLPSETADGQELTLAGADRLGRQAFRSGNFSEAVRYFRIALQKAEAEGASAEELVAILGNIGEMLRSARQYQEAETYFNRGLDILRANSIADKSYFPVILGDLGRLYEETGRYSRSESSLKQALSITERELGANHWNMSKILNSLGIPYMSTDKRK